MDRTSDTELTAFRDDCPELRAILVAAGVTSPPARDLDHGRHGQLPGRPALRQVAANALVSTRADLLLQIRCAVYDGALDSMFGQLFEMVPNPSLPSAMAV